jgi:non-lysosomal glucosylceramidase
MEPSPIWSTHIYLLLCCGAMCAEARKGLHLDRYDGLRRNPWNEVECGSHYARAMSTWRLLLALSSYHYSASEKWISFAPLVNAQDFRWFFSTGNAWGVFFQKSGEESRTASLHLKKGTLELSDLRLNQAFEAKSVTANFAGNAVESRVTLLSGQARIQFAKLLSSSGSDAPA